MAARGKVVAAVGLMILLAGRLLAGPREELLRLVPDDAGFCLLVQDLRSHSADLRDSPFLAQLQQSRLGASLRGSKELEKLAKASTHLEKKVGLTWAALRDDILGDAVAFAYRPGPPDRPRDEQGLFLLRARNADRLAALMQRLNDVEKTEGDLKEVEERQHQGTAYYRRQGRRKTTFYFLQGPILVMSEQEGAVQQAIERSQAATGERRALRQLRELGADQAAVALWVNPRAFDPALRQRPGMDARAAAATRQLTAYWKALDSAVLALHLDRDVRLSLTLQVQREQLPAVARRWLDRPLEASPLWRHFPDNALLALAARVDLSGAFTALSEFLPPEGQKEMQAGFNRSLGAVLDRDVIKDVLPALGPDCGICVTAPGRDQGSLPQVLLALRVRPSSDDEPIDQALVSALSSLATLLILHHNQQDPDHPIHLRRTREKPEIKYLSSTGFPSGIEPALGLNKGYLVLGSSVELLRRFGEMAGPKPALNDPVPLLRVSFKAWREYLSAQGDALARPMADAQGVPTDQVQQQLSGMLDLLQLLDRLELCQRCRGDQLSFTLSLQTAVPLRK